MLGDTVINRLKLCIPRPGGLLILEHGATGGTRMAGTAELDRWGETAADSGTSSTPDHIEAERTPPAAGPQPARAGDKARPVFLIIEPFTLYREALAMLFRPLSRQYEVVTLPDICELTKWAKEAWHRSGIVLMSIDEQTMPIDALEAELHSVRQTTSGWPIIVLGQGRPCETIVPMLLSETQGYLPRSTTSSVALHAIRLVAAGGKFLPMEIFKYVNDHVSALPAKSSSRSVKSWNKDVEPPNLDFTCRQYEVLKLLGQGLPNKIIAYRLGMQVSTVKIHVRNIMRKLNVTSRVQAALYAQTLDEGAFGADLAEN